MRVILKNSDNENAKELRDKRSNLTIAQPLLIFNYKKIFVAKKYYYIDIIITLFYFILFMLFYFIYVSGN